MECENLEEVKPSLVARFGKILFSGYAISHFLYQLLQYYILPIGVNITYQTLVTIFFTN